MVKSEAEAGENTLTMSPPQIELYARIQAFAFDQPTAPLAFSQRLARENGWTWFYAQQVIEEYKKFAFLAIAADHPVTPSDQVDQAWHLHLTYTRSYWDAFCPLVLQASLHHDPTQGGRSENQKFEDWYGKTLESYQQFFGQAPPAAIWPAPQKRFGRDVNFRRVNTQQNWILPKLPLPNWEQSSGAMGASVAIALTLLLGGCYITGPASALSSAAGIPLIIICLLAGFGMTRMLVGIVDFIKNPQRPRIGGCSSVDYGGSGENNWYHQGHRQLGNDDAGGHGASGDSSGGDFGGGTGCGGAGCGGAGCGGGGCGGG